MIAVSSPGPQSIRSRPPRAARTRSSPAPALAVSLPRPPRISSSPAPPRISSLAAPPRISSAPPLPLSRSRPPFPSRQSSSPLPSRRSSPPLPTIRSEPLVPASSSFLRALDAVRAGVLGAERPDAVGDPDREEALKAVGVPDLAALGDERWARHRPVAGLEPGDGARSDRGVEVGDLPRVAGVADVEDPQAREDHAAGDDPGVGAPRNVAVVAGVALERELAPGSPACASKFSGWCTSRRRFETTRGLRLVGDVDDPPGADLVLGCRTRRSRPRRGAPSIVTGIAFCGMLIESQVRRAISRTWGPAPAPGSRRCRG